MSISVLARTHTVTIAIEIAEVSTSVVKRSSPSRWSMHSQNIENLARFAINDEDERLFLWDINKLMMI